MAVLSEGRRRDLEKTVQRARDVAEHGARAAIKALAVHAAEPFSSLSPDERNLRIRLRARARQLGDTRGAKTGEHGIEHLVVECAYEHWHRMLFARFLAENNVLMHPDGVPVTLEECEELAPSEGAADGWELAAWYAAEMLPQIFRPGSPIFELKLPPEKGRELERLLADLPPEVFTASDSLGWVYQFWQAKKKKEVNDSEVKIGADELPAVTQLFTEPYMVQFLLHNTLGAWWVGRHGRESLPVEMPYLRFLDDGTPAAGTFDGWPETTRDLKVLDPCCGSGHFLVAAFEILVRFRMAEEGLAPADACAAVLRDNLHGLEIDERCTQIAAFALALAAWTFPDAGGYRVLSEMHIACSGLAPRAKKEEWLALAGDDVRLKNGMERLYELFQDAPVLGSLIDPRAVGVSQGQRELGVAAFEELRPMLDQHMERERAHHDASATEVRNAARGIGEAAAILSRQYSLVMTNVPYLGRNKQDDALQNYLAQRYTAAKDDLATAFMMRCLELCSTSGTTALVLNQTWLSLATYKTLRQELLRNKTWSLLARLGAGAFETISGHVVNVALVVISAQRPQPKGIFFGVDATSARVPADKIRCLLGTPVLIDQASQLKNPESRVAIGGLSVSTTLKNFCMIYEGTGRGDTERFDRKFWELGYPIAGQWAQLLNSPDRTGPFRGRETVFLWENGAGALTRTTSARIRGLDAWGKRAVFVGRTSGIRATLSLGEVHAQNGVAVVPARLEDLPALWAYCSSDEYRTEVRKLSTKVIVPSSALWDVPFDAKRWRAIARERYPKGLPEPHSDDPSQWIFNGKVHPSTEPLQVTVARLLGYRWPQQGQDGLDDLIDEDGIVCLPAVRGEQPAATRLQQVLARAFGDEWSPHKQAELLEAVGCKGWTLERWLSERFFQQHCQVFQHRPFIWHIWDGLKKGGFGALVNYHKLDRKLLETLTYNYLGDWIRRQQDGAKRGEDGADERLAAARGLQERLKRILEGEPPCDIFVRWKPIEKQPMGWEPDIDDGVRINIRPFMLVDDVGKRGAGVLRDKPNIKWGKDRGKDPAGSPWYDEFGGERNNDHHLTLAAKRAARAAAEGVA